MDDYRIAESRYDDEPPKYHVYFARAELRALSILLSTHFWYDNLSAIDKMVKVLHFIESNNRRQTFEADLEREHGYDFWEDADHEYDQGKPLVQRVADGTGYHLGRIATIISTEYHAPLFYQKSSNRLVTFGAFQPLTTDPLFLTLQELRTYLLWWKETLIQLKSGALIPSHVLRYPVSQSENEEQLRRVDYHYDLFTW